METKRPSYIPIRDNGKHGCQLVHIGTKQPVREGEILTGLRGAKVKVTAFMPPQHAGSTGRVEVKPLHATYTNLFYPNVYNLQIVEKVTA